MTCDACEKAATNPHCGVYRMQCLECCTRLVLSTHPSKQLAAATTGIRSRMKCACCKARARRGGAFDKNCPRCRVQHVAMQPTAQLRREWISYYERRFGMQEGSRLRRILWRWWELTRTARDRKKQAGIVQGKVAGKKTA